MFVGELTSGCSDKLNDPIAEVVRSTINIEIIQLLACRAIIEGEAWQLWTRSHFFRADESLPMLYLFVIVSIVVYNFFDVVYMIACPGGWKKDGPFFLHHGAVILGAILPLCSRRYYCVGLIGAMIEISSISYNLRVMAKHHCIGRVTVEQYDRFYRPFYVLVRLVCIYWFVIHFQSDAPVWINCIYVATTGALSVFSLGYAGLMCFGRKKHD